MSIKKASILVFLSACLLACSNDKKEGIVQIIVNDSVISKFDVVLDRNISYSRYRDSSIVRFRTGFVNEAIKLGSSEHNCITYGSINSDFSTGYAGSYTIKAEGEWIYLKVRGFVYRIPVAKDFIFIDVSIKADDVLYIQFSNKLLRLS